MLFTPRNTDSSHTSKNNNDSFFKTRVQPKLAVGQPGDKYEVEADKTADKVVQKINTPQPIQTSPTPFFAPKTVVQSKKDTIQQKEKGEKEQEVQEKPLSESITPVVQTSLLEEPIQEKCDACEEKETTPIQKKCKDCEEKAAGSTTIQQKCDACEKEEKVQAKQDAGNKSTESDLSSKLTQSKGGGVGMDASTQQQMSSGFGSDFSNVRIHTDSNAVQMNKELGSHAFTNGSDVYFNSGKYDPSSDSGKHLLAHELTHTVQQGASGKTVAKKENPEAEEITPVQTKSSETALQKADDPCADVKPKEEAKKEDTKTEKDCKAHYIPAEDPGDREEPDQEEQPKDIEAKPEMGAEDRQKGAPPVDGAPKDVESPAENPLEICKKREEKQAQTGKGQGAKEANSKPAAEGEKGGANEPPKGGEAKEKPAETKTEGKGGKKNGKEKKSLADEVQNNGKKGISPVPMGEMSSPIQVAERDLHLALTAASIGGVRGTQARIQTLGMTPLHFNTNADSSATAASAMANNFMSSKSSKATSLIDTGLLAVDGVQQDTALKRLEIENDIAAKKQRSSAFFRKKAAASVQSAMKAKMAMNQQHMMTVLQIEMKAMTDTKLLNDAFRKMSAEISLKYISQVINLNQAYSKSYNNHLQIGRQQGQKAKQMGYTMASDYRTASVEGASAKDQKLVRGKEKDGFWDGYLTYNRYMARADSAIETGKQYQEGMQTQAKEKADKLMCEKTSQLAITKEIAAQGTQNLRCALDDAMDAIQLRKTAAIGQATAAKDEFTKNIDAALKGTLNELKEKQVGQELVINDFGARQIVALENSSLQAQIGLLKGIQALADDLKSQLESFAASVNGMDAPDPNDYEQQLLGVDAQFEAGLQATSSGISSAIAVANEMVNSSYTMARGIIDGVYEQGISDGQLIYTTYDELMKGIDAKRLEFFTQHLQTSIQGLQTDYDQGLARMNSVVAMIGMAYEHLLNGLKANMKASEDGLVEGMTKTINQDLKATICSQAETAAAEVQPWWKSVLKVLLVILVIVIVIALTIVTAGAFAAIAAPIAGAIGLGGSALAVTLIAGAIAGAVMGALSSVLITVGMNVINLAGTGKLTWSAAFEGALDAAIQGAIAGAIGGMAGPLVGVFSKGVGVLGKVLIEEGVELAFDVLGGVIGDLVLHGEVKDWGNILFGAIVARGIANGVKIVPKIKTKIMGNKGAGADVNTSGTKTKTAAGPEGSTPKTNTDGGTPKTNAEGGTTPKTNETGAPGGKKNKPVSEGQQQAKKMGYPEAPEGYHWRKGANGEPTLAKNPGSKGGKMKYDPETGTFKNADAVSAPKKKFGDEADFQNDKIVVNKKKAVDGHELKIDANANIAKCSDCKLFEVTHKDILDADVNLQDELKAIRKKMTDEINANGKVSDKTMDKLQKFDEKMSRAETLAKDPQNGKINQKSIDETTAIIKLEESGGVINPRRPNLSLGEPNLDFKIDGPKPYNWADVKTPVNMGDLSKQAKGIGKKVTLQKAGSVDVLHVIDLKKIPPVEKANFMQEVVNSAGSPNGIVFINI